MTSPAKAVTPPAVSMAPPVVSPRRPGAVTAGPGMRREPAPGVADLVRAQSVVGNAAVAAALTGVPPGGVARTDGGDPRGVPPALSGLMGPMPSAGRGPAGNAAVAATAGRVVAGRVVTAPLRPATPGEAGSQPGAVKAKAPPAPGPDLKEQGRTGSSTVDRPDRPTTTKTEPVARRSPGTDPKFQALKKDVNTKKTAVASSHPPAVAEATAAQAAAVPPPDDRQARGKAAHADDMDAAQPKEFDKATFIRAVEQAIAAKAPKNLDEADRFGDSGKADEVKAEVQGEVGESKDASAEEIATTTAQVPEPAPDTKTVVPLAPDRLPGRPGAPDANQAAPDKLPPSATDLSAGPAQIDRQMAAAQVTEQQLSFKNSREPSFDKAVKETNALEAHSRSAPRQLRGAEAQEIGRVKNAAGSDGTDAMAAMHGTRAATGRKVGAGKTGARGRDEDRRATVTALLQAVFDKTKTDVEKILSDLDTTVDRQFTTGEKRARDRFTTEHKLGMRRYKRERYSAWNGAFLWAKDQFLPLPEEANRIYEDAKANYLTAMRQVIAEIADTVEAQLRRAKDRIAAGRGELQAAVRKLPADLRAIGQEAAAEFTGRFDELRDTVTAKGTELVDTLATRYTEAVTSVDAEIAVEKEKNRGLIAKAVDAVAGAIKAIKELANLLLGVLRKAAQAIGAILKDPIGFLGNLVSAVGGGLRLFMRNIGKHLQQGVLSWLLGTASSAGLRIPATFDVRGITLMVTALLGLTWGNIRARITRKVPDQAVTAAETAVPLVAQVKKQGAAGLWDDMRTRVGDLRKTLIDKVIAYLIPTIIVAGITWVLSLLNPASAFIRACKMIIDILRFIVTQGRQIIEFVNAVLDAVIAIAKGGAGGVPALVERALARSIPVLIGALAAILGIGGIAAKVKQIFQTLAQPVNRAVDWAVDKIVGLVKGLWARLKTATDRRRRPPTPDRRRPAAVAPPRPRRRDRPDRRRPDRRKPGTATPSGQRRRDARSERDLDRVLSAALSDARALVRARLPVEEIKDRLPGIRRRHRLSGLALVADRVQGTRQIVHFVAVINPAKESPAEGTPLSREVVRADYGVLLKNQLVFQRYADQRQLVIDVRPTNPESVRHLERGAFYKPEDIKAKTINSADLLLSVEPEKQGLVGFFVNKPPEPKRRGLSDQERAKGRDRYRMRVEERRMYGQKMQKLARKNKGPGRFEVLGYVVHGYDEAGNRHPIAGDHDLYDIRRPDGSELPTDEYDLLIADMRRKEFGVMHGAVVYWDPKPQHMREMRAKLLAQHRRSGSEGLVRFAPGQPPRFVYADTPL